ncbi:hypothetical protein ACFL2Q_17480, partial [Thermodesulfobacteriota bacterium]
VAAHRRRVEAELTETERSYRFLFEEAPMAISEEDRSETKRYAERLRDSGITDIPRYFRENYDEALRLLGMTRVVSLNKETTRMLPVNTCDEMTQHYRDLASVQGKAMVQEKAWMTVQLALQGVNQAHSEMTYVHPDGGTGYGIGSFKVLPGYEETWERVWVSVTDITDLRRAQQALTESEIRFRSIFEAAEDAVFSLA